MLGSRMGLGVLGASFSTASIYNIEYILIQRFRLCVFTFHVLIPKSLLFSISVCCPGFPRPPFSTRYSMILFPGKKDTIYQKCCWSEDSFYSLASHNSHPFHGRKLQTANINVCDCAWPLMRHSPVCSCYPRTPGRPRTPRPRHSRPRPPRRAGPGSSTGPGQPPAPRSAMLTNNQYLLCF